MGLKRSLIGSFAKLQFCDGSPYRSLLKGHACGRFGQQGHVTIAAAVERCAHFLCKFARRAWSDSWIVADRLAWMLAVRAGPTVVVCNATFWG
jgi:hypothetical protein